MASLKTEAKRKLGKGNRPGTEYITFAAIFPLQISLYFYPHVRCECHFTNTR